MTPRQIWERAREVAKEATAVSRSRRSLMFERNALGERRYSSGALRYGLIGCGDVGYRNASAIARSTNSRLAAVCDVREELARELGRRYGVRAYTDYRELLEDDDVDVVIIALPHHLHAEVSVRALEAGRHVIVEKPMAVTLDEGRQMMAAEEKSGKTLSVCFPERYALRSLLARDLIRSGEPGEVATVAIHCKLYREPAYWTGGFSGRSRSDWRSRLACAGGGVLMMNGIHWIDLVLWMVGSEVSDVRALTRNASPAFKDVEDQVVMHFTINQRTLASVIGTTRWPLTSVEEVEVVCEHGALVVGRDLLVRPSKTVRGFRPGRTYRVVENPRLNERTTFYNECSDAILGKRPPGVSSSDGLRALKVVLEAYGRA